MQIPRVVQVTVEDGEPAFSISWDGAHPMEGEAMIHGWQCQCFATRAAAERAMKAAQRVKAQRKLDAKLAAAAAERLRARGEGA